MTSHLYLLDTNVISDLIRNPSGAVRRHLGIVGADTVCTSIVVACELRYGAVRKGSPRLARLVDDLLDELHVYPFESPSERTYAAVREDLERNGHPIGGNDLLIAAHTLSLGCILVTANTREFDRVPGLKVKNWLR